MEKSNLLPKILVIHTASKDPIETYYPTEKFQNHKQYWNQFLSVHPEISISPNLTRDEIAFEMVNLGNFVFLDITNYHGKIDTPPIGILFLPTISSVQDIEYLFLLKKILKPLAYLEIIYHIQKVEDIWHYQSISQISTEKKIAVDIIDDIYNQLEIKEFTQECFKKTS